MGTRRPPALRRDDRFKTRDLRIAATARATSGAGPWFVDRSEGAAPSVRFRILEAGADTLRVEDDRGGGARTVNRPLFESQMKPEGADEVPVSARMTYRRVEPEPPKLTYRRIFPEEATDETKAANLPDVRDAGHDVRGLPDAARVSGAAREDLRKATKRCDVCGEDVRSDNVMQRRRRGRDQNVCVDCL